MFWTFNWGDVLDQIDGRRIVLEGRALPSFLVGVVPSLVAGRLSMHCAGANRGGGALLNTGEHKPRRG